MLSYMCLWLSTPSFLTAEHWAVMCSLALLTWTPLSWVPSCSEVQFYLTSSWKHPPTSSAGQFSFSQMESLYDVVLGSPPLSIFP